MNQRRPAILLCLCLILLSALPTTALTTDLQAAIEESTPSAEQNISPANPTQEQNPMENNESASLPEPPTREMDLETKDLRRTQNPASKPFIVEGTSLTESDEGDYYYNTHDNELVILSDKPCKIKMSDPSASASSIGIRVNAKDADITLDNVNIDTTSTTNPAIKIEQGPATIRLSGNNVLKSPNDTEGIQLLSSLTITSSDGDGNPNGTLTVTGGSDAAGIGPAKTQFATAKLMIRGGTIIAQGGENAAGIGGVLNNNDSDITISDGTVTATGGSGGAGIGGSSNHGNGSKITISGGDVTATGGDNAAGIGGGNGGNGSKITISGGTVTATGGSGGAGIGGGSNSNGSKITISGGTVTAIGNNRAAGIGGGHAGNGSEITISDGTVTATGGPNAAGIGGGYLKNGSEITINGGMVTATGGDSGAGIGGGNSGSNGNGGNALNININSGTVTAIGKDNAAGIGIGGNGNQSQITIRDGQITAITQTENGIAVGGNTSTITISGGQITAKAEHANSVAIAADNVIVSPSANHKIEIKAGENENNASTIEGSPFITQNNISDKVNTAKYFNSTTSAYNPPPTPPAVRRYRIELSAEPAEGGAVSGEGRYKRNTEVTVNAAPNSGYRFVHWTENGEIMSTEASYTFSAKKNRMLVAVFAKDIVPTLEKETDDPSHSWTVSFNKALDPADVTSENFHILDANGKLLQGIRPVLLENSRQVRMENTTRFEENKDYFLVIRKGVRSAKERALAKDVIMKFQYKVK